MLRKSSCSCSWRHLVKRRANRRTEGFVHVGTDCCRQIASRLPVGCRSVAGRLWATGRQPIGNQQVVGHNLLVAGRLPIGCRSVAGNRSATDRQPAGCRSVADRLPVGCRSEAKQQCCANVHKTLCMDPRLVSLKLGIERWRRRWVPS